MSTHSSGPKTTPRLYPKVVTRKLPPIKEKQKHEKTSMLQKYDIFSDNWLVDKPRKILSEKTTIGLPTNLLESLEQFYADIAQIPEGKTTKTVLKMKNFMEYVLPRMIKLGNPIGMKIKKVIYAGSTFDDTQVILPHEVDIFVIFERFAAKVTNLNAGYAKIPLKTFREKEGEKPDQWRYGRSFDGKYLSSFIVGQNMHMLIDRALKLYPSAKVEPYGLTDGSAPICVFLKERYKINFIPASPIEDEDCYLVARPYMYDADSESEMFWRFSFIEKEQYILSSMDLADRGIRRKAFKILKALVKTEHTLKGLSSYQIKTVLLHTFDSDVDHTPRWQRNNLESCFLTLLRELLHFLTAGVLPHFFMRSLNLFEHMPSRLIYSLKMRVGYLLTNHNELNRILKKR